MIKNWRERYETHANNFEEALQYAKGWAKEHDKKVNPNREPEDPSGHFWITFDALEFEINYSMVQRYHFIIDYKKE